MKTNRHGADLYALEKKYHYRPEDIRDFSSNINPLGPSPKAMEAAAKNIGALCRYPDPEYRKLKAAIAEYLKVPHGSVLLGCGTSQLIQAAIDCLKPARALINSPCYSEYERELEKIGAAVAEYQLDYHKNFAIDVDDIVERINEEGAELYVLTNPNNPTGSILTRADVARILDETDAYVLVDETYIEFTDPAIYSAVPLVSSRRKLIVIRGTSKFFATPGIRLGYALTGDEKLSEALAGELSIWGINSMADVMGRVMFKDDAYRDESFRLIQREKEKVITALETIPALKIFPSYGNFVLVKIKDRSHTAAELREALLAQKIVIRDCAGFKNLDERFFRFCLLDPESNDALIRAVKDFFEKD